MQSKLRTLILLGCIVGLLLSACGSSNPLVGTWEDALGMKYTFTSGGKVTLDMGVGAQVAGTYKILGNNQVELTMGGLGDLLGSMVYDYQVSGNQLTLSIMGVPNVLTRVR